MSEEIAFRCAAAAIERGDELIGSATHVRAFLLVEHPGPWGRSALQDAALPQPVLAGMRAASARTGVRILLARRHGRQPQTGVRVLAAHCAAPAPWLQTALLERHEQVLDLDLDALAAGRDPGLEPAAGPVVGVCTHGRHDACCAERGRPVAAALAAAYPELTWEVSHLGGDRFAGNLLMLPDGLGYGRVRPEDAVPLVRAHLDGRLTPELLRGRAAYPMPVQVAELAVRRHLDAWLDAEVTLVGHQRAGDRVTALFAHRGARYAVAVTVGEHADRVKLTCAAAAESARPDYRPGPVERVSG